ncbi:hypothetical protein VaNZ11_004724 [Volvox africanus]|uniref:Uncharacterized protein n=1 Tax=Volvox africanus TaxID=51714 RepID=A0ABQ5RYM3_9CHLO|nr:hypothetical protein VaNZ11_004724 [Volvox africanus]
MSAMWPDVECVVCKVEDGILLDAAVMAAIMCALKEELAPLEDSLAAAIIDVMKTFVLGMPRPKGFVFIPCAVNEVKCLKDFLLGDAVHLLPTGEEDVSPRDAEDVTPCEDDACKPPEKTAHNITSARSSHTSEGALPGEQYCAGVLGGSAPIACVQVLTWRDQLCAPDTIGMALVAVFSGDTLRSAGPLGVVYTDLQEALSRQDQSALNRAQTAAEHFYWSYCLGSFWASICVLRTFGR